MKKLILPAICTFLATSLSGCGLMEDAFKAGFIIAMIIVAIVGLLVWILHFSYKLLVDRFPQIGIFANHLKEELNR